MRKLSMFIMLCAFSAGCVCGPKYPPEFKSEIQRNAARMFTFMKHVEAKTTTRQDEIDMLKANFDAWLKLESVVK